MSAHQLFIHLAWTTLNRSPMIDAATRRFLETFFKKTAAKQDVEIVEVAMLKTHVQPFVSICAINPNITPTKRSKRLSFRTMSAEHTL